MLGSPWLVTGVAAGLGVAALDAATARISGVQITSLSVAYALTVAACAGGAAGALITALNALRPAAGRVFSRGADLLVTVPIVALFVVLAVPLFDGAWIRSQGWAPVVKWSVLILGSVALMVTIQLWPRIARLRGPKGACALAAALLIAAVAAHFNLRAFLNYPTLHWMLSLVTFAALGAAVAPRVVFRHALILGALLCAAATGGAVAVRSEPTIDSARSLIVGAPFAATSRFLVPVESVWLDRFGSRPAVTPPSQGADAALDALLDPRFDADAVLAELDRSAPGRSKFNVLIVALDALRADHLSCEGYHRRTTPRIDAFARTASWFRRAVSPVPASDQGYSSTFTGLLPRVTPAYASEFGISFPVPPDFSLASRHRAAGFRTAGITAFHPGVAAQPQFRVLAQGFDVWNPDSRTDELRGDAVTTATIREIDDSAKSTAPFLIFSHYMEPHAPYYFHATHNFGNEPVDAYDGEIAEADEHFGRLLDHLSERGITDRTIVALFGDHGEGFGEHNNREHGASLHEHQVRVPLIVRVPGIAAREIRGWVSLSDLPVTLMRLQSVADPYRRLGRDLSPLMVGATGTWPDLAYAERSARPSNEIRSWERALWHGDLKVVWKPQHGTLEAWDLAKDPGELTNIFDRANPAQAQMLALMGAYDRRIDAYWTGSPGAAPQVATLSEKFEEAVAVLEAATDEAAASRALDRIVAFLAAPGVDKLRSERRRLGEAGWARLQAWLVAHIPAMGRDTRARTLGMRLLAFADDPALDGFLFIEAGRSGAVQTVVESMLTLARHANPEARVPLGIGLDHGFMDGRVFCAAALSAYGEPVRKEWLTAGLDRTWPELVEMCSLALTLHRDPAPIARAALSTHRTWSDAVVEHSLVFACTQSSSFTANAVLLRLSASAHDGISAAATAELQKRFAGEHLKAAIASREAFAGAENALLYHDAKLALRFLAPLGPADDPAVGLRWWTAFRIACDAGDRAEAERFLERLLAAASDIPGIAAAVAAFRHDPVGCAAARADVSDCIVGERLGDVLMPLVSVGEAFVVTVRVTNASARYLAGGVWPGDLRLGWQILAEDGAIVPPVEDIVTNLPLGGLSPGASVDLTVMGRLPLQRGRYTLRLVAHPTGVTPAMAPVLTTIGPPIDVVLP